MANDTAFFSTTQGGPGGAFALGMSPIGPGSVSPSAQIPPSASPAAGAPKSFTIPPVVWVFVLLIVGYWGLHQSLKVV